jgi:uncharacterized protein YifE (UPF0438 family)
MVVNPTCTKNFLYKKKYPAALRRGFFILNEIEELKKLIDGFKELESYNN